MRTRRAKTPRPQLSSFSRLRCAKGGTGKRARPRGMVHFHLELPLAHNHPPLRPSAKISEAPEYPFTREPAKAISWYITRPPGHITSSPGISRHDLSRSGRGRREGEEGRDLVGGRRGGEREREEGETGSVKIRRDRGTRSMKERRRREDDESRVEKEEEEEGEKGRATSARSRATIGDHLPSRALSRPPVFQAEGEKSTTGRLLAAAQPPLPLSNYSLTPRAIYLRSSAIITCYYLILTLLAI